MGTAARAPEVSSGAGVDAQVLPQADFLEGHAGDVEPVGAAHFVFAVDVVQVAAREGGKCAPGRP